MKCRWVGGSDELGLGSNQVIVIGLFGTSESNKSDILNGILESPIFSEVDFDYLPTSSCDWKSETNSPQNESPFQIKSTNITELVEVYHDRQNGIIYLQLSSLCESAYLVSSLSRLQHLDLHSISSSEFYLSLEASQLNHVKALLFMFLVCHHVFIFQPRARFEMELLRTFNLLQLAKSITIPNLTSQNSQSLPSHFIPTVSFLFPDPNFISDGKEESDNSAISSRYKKFRTNLETQVSLLLRRVTMKDSDRDRKRSRESLKKAENPRIRPSRKSRGLDTQSEVDSPELYPLFTLHPQKAVILLPDLHKHSKCVLSTGLLDPHSLKNTSDRYESATKEIQAMILRNIDFIRRHPQGRKDLPSSQDWFRLALIAKKAAFTQEDVGFQFNDLLDPLFQLSMARCERALKNARRAYASLSVEKSYLEAVEEAINLYRKTATGPAAEHYESIFRKECTQDKSKQNRTPGTASNVNTRNDTGMTLKLSRQHSQRTRNEYREIPKRTEQSEYREKRIEQPEYREIPKRTEQPEVRIRENYSDSRRKVYKQKSKTNVT